MNPHGQKQNCERCKAFMSRTHGCGLGYSVEIKAFDAYGFTNFGIPQEPCPKPMTNSDFILAKKHYKKKREAILKGSEVRFARKANPPYPMTVQAIKIDGDRKRVKVNSKWWPASSFITEKEWQERHNNPLHNEPARRRPLSGSS